MKDKQRLLILLKQKIIEKKYVFLWLLLYYILFAIFYCGHTQKYAYRFQISATYLQGLGVYLLMKFTALLYQLADWDPYTSCCCSDTICAWWCMSFLSELQSPTVHFGNVSRYSPIGTAASVQSSPHSAWALYLAAASYAHRETPLRDASRQSWSHRP